VGAILSDKLPLICFNLAAGTTTESLVAHPTKAGVFVPQTTAWSTVMYETIGVFAAVVRNALNNVMDATEYAFTADGIRFTGTAGTSIQFYKKAATGSSDKFAFLGDTFYRGENPVWNRLLLSIDNGSWASYTRPADGVGYLQISSVTIGVKAVYAATTSRARQFISPNQNWIADHWNTSPDLFVGTYDYPGDNYQDGNGTPVEPGDMPLFREPGTYSLNVRDGVVEFPEFIDSVANPVRANYAYLAGVDNVTGMKLDAVTGSSNKLFKAQSESLFTAAHGKRIVNRDDAFTPINVYVDGVITPQEIPIAPYDTLEVIR
jgi:hypothetical protein